MIYESNISRIPLIKEIELLKNYIDLEQLRYGNRLDFSITISGNIKEYQIAPLLLLPFLENAFKYGTSQQIEQCWISLDLSIVDSSMYFKLVNSVEMNKGTKAKKVSGLGLQNVKRRLELLYKDKYSFETILQDEVFIVNLNLQLEYLEEKFEQIMTLT
jgi:sensor histidine kinase YesM